MAPVLIRAITRGCGYTTISLSMEFIESNPLEGASYMSKRKGAVALAACALLAIGGIARAADPVPTTSFESQPLSLATDVQAPTPMSVLNEQVFDRTPLGKIFKDTGIKAGGW